MTTSVNIGGRTTLHSIVNMRDGEEKTVTELFAGGGGTPGPAGADGLSVTWKGAWSGAVSYVKNDAVSYLGGSYIAKEASTNIPPADAAESADQWSIMAEPGVGITNIAAAQADGIVTLTFTMSDGTLKPVTFSLPEAP